jgi:hypothetical protein
MGALIDGGLVGALVDKDTINETLADYAQNVVGDDSLGGAILNAVVDNIVDKDSTSKKKTVEVTATPGDYGKAMGDEHATYFMPSTGGEVTTSSNLFQSSPLLNTYSPRLFGAPYQLTHLADMRLLSSADGSKPGPVGDFYLEKILENAEIANIVPGRAIFTGGMNGLLSGLRNLIGYASALKKYGDYIQNNTPDNTFKVENGGAWSSALDDANLENYKKAMGDKDNPESKDLKTETMVVDGSTITVGTVPGEIASMLDSLQSIAGKMDMGIGTLTTAMKTSFAVQQPFYTFDSDWFSYINKVKMMINAFTVMLGLGNASVRIDENMMKIGGMAQYKEGTDVWAMYRFITPNKDTGDVTAIDKQNGDTSQYVSFMIEPSGSSESYTNSVGESQIYSSVINSGSSIGNEIAFLTNSSQSAIDDAIVNIASKSINAAESVLSSLSGGIGRFTASIAGSMAKSYVGEHTIYPQIFQSSTSTTSKSFVIHLNSPGGSPYEYLMNICVPLAYILNLVLPSMSKGSASAYAYPPVIQCNIPGLWGTRLGMVTQVDVSKNPSGKDFSIHGFPLSVDVNMTIADLQHVMVSTGINQPAMFLNNNTMFDYIAQCAGVDKYRVNGSMRLITKLTLGIQACSPTGLFANIGDSLHNDINSRANKILGTYKI